MNLSIKLDSPCELINVVPFNPLIYKCQIKVCWVGDEPNRNRSVITKDVAREMANSLPGSPIVGFYNEATGDFEEHNRMIDISNGEFKIKDTTRPYGFVDLGAKCWFQKFDDDGVEHEYLMTEGWLWTGQYQEAKRILEKGNNQSMELDDKLINAHWTKDGNGKPQFFIINEAIISKLCILGEECEPCFEGAQITKVQFSFEEGFKETLFSMMNELKEMLNEGGTPVFTTYAVEIGDALWCALHDHIVNSYPAEDCEFCSMYRIEGIYEEDGQKFAILHDAPKDVYYRLDFSVGEEGYAFNADLISVEKEFVPVAEAPQFDPEAYSAYETSYAASKKSAKEEEEDKKDDEEEEEKCPKCGKPLSECDCEDEEEEDEDKKDKYVLEEIQEYVELSNAHNELMEKYSALEGANAELVSANEALEASKVTMETELNELREFKLVVERKEKEAMIRDDFYMLSDDDKKDVMDNIDTYSLDDIEAKLSVLCKRKKISFEKEEETTGKTDPTVYNLGEVDLTDSQIPAWIKAVLETQKNM